MKLICLVLALLTFGQIIDAQPISQNIRGKVIDKVTKQPLVEAQVVIKNSIPLLGDKTNEQGRFEITQVPLGRYQIQISYIGYNTVTLNDVQLNQRFIKVD